MKSNILNKLEYKMVLIVLIIIGCIYFVINNKNKEGYKNKKKYNISNLLKRPRYNYKKLSTDNKKLYNAYKNNITNFIKNMRITTKNTITRLNSFDTKNTITRLNSFDTKINEINALQNPFRAYNKFTNKIDYLDYDKLGIRQLLESTMKFAKDGRPSRYYGYKRWDMLKKILDIKTLPKMSSYKVFPIVCPLLIQYLDSGSCPYPNITLYIYNNIKDILDKFYSPSKFVNKKNYMIIEGKVTTAYGKELVAPGGLITTLQKFIFAWFKFTSINSNWKTEHPEYNILYTVFDTISAQALSEKETTSLAKDIKSDNMTNIYDVLFINLNKNDTFKQVAIKSLLPSEDKNKPIDFIKDEFMYIARLFVYLAEIFKDVMPQNNTSLFKKYSDTEDLNLNEYEQKLIETFSNLGNKNLKNDIVYNYIAEKASEQNTGLGSIWTKLHNNMQSLIRKLYFPKPADLATPTA